MALQASAAFGGLDLLGVESSHVLWGSAVVWDGVAPGGPVSKINQFALLAAERAPWIRGFPPCRLATMRAIDKGI